jgi:fibronectin-binding autotransporter adhesin
MGIPFSSLGRRVSGFLGETVFFLFLTSTCTTSLFATTGTWNLNANGNWNVDGNWTGTAFPNGTTDDAIFNDIFTGQRTIDFQQALNVGSMTFNQSKLLVFTNSNGQAITLNGTNISVNGVGNIVFRQTVSLASLTNVWSGNGTAILDFTKTVSEVTTGTSVEKTGSFSLLLDGPLNISGAFILDSGTNGLQSINPYGAATNILINGGTLDATLAPRTITNAFTIAGNYTVDSDHGLTNSGPIHLGSSTHIVTIDAVTNFWRGVVDGSGNAGISKAGSGFLSLDANNTFSGDVTNSAGTMIVNAAQSLGIGNSASPNAMTIAVTGGTLLFNVGVTNTSGNVLLSGGTFQEVDQNISLGVLTVSANSSIQLDSDATAAILRFGSGTNTVGAGAVLTIYGWNYNSVTDSGSDDLIFFTSATAETASFLNNITFFGLGQGARILSTGELVPITPEPQTILYGFLLCIFCPLALIRSRWKSSSARGIH